MDCHYFNGKVEDYFEFSECELCQNYVTCKDYMKKKEEREIYERERTQNPSQKA